MAEAVKFRRRRMLTPEEEARQQLMEEMAQTRLQLNQAYADFNVQSDPDLVDSCVFTINALRSRHSYLVRQIKLLEAGKGDVG
ncbi:MAG TPA: DUF2508 family protein [Candidatus Enterenecus stercoripullorum]|nr:DUF2508 family protein [Candidatus Enterenecus stercoripullorum]